MEIRDVLIPTDAALDALDDGEASAIALASEVSAQMLLMDERKGVSVARSRGLTVTGTLGALMLAAEQDLLDLAEAFDRLRKTNFHCTEQLYDQLLRDAATGRNR